MSGKQAGPCTHPQSSTQGEHEAHLGRREPVSAFSQKLDEAHIAAYAGMDAIRGGAADPKGDERPAFRSTRNVLSECAHGVCRTQEHLLMLMQDQQRQWSAQRCHTEPGGLPPERLGTPTPGPGGRAHGGAVTGRRSGPRSPLSERTAAAHLLLPLQRTDQSMSVVCWGWGGTQTV